MVNAEKIIVKIDFGKSSFEVGELLLERGKIYFKFYPDFIDSGIEISPFKLPLSDKIYSAEPHPYEGLFGVFNDSLPDGWGRLLLDRKLSSLNINLDEISPLDRLAFVGFDGMGALSYYPELNIKTNGFSLDFDHISEEINNILEGFESDIFDEIYRLGGSSGGARPKILIAYHSKTGHVLQNSKRLKEGYENWLVKFPNSMDPKDIANIEYAYYLMALDAGIEMSDCKLFKGNSGNVYFGTKRFDRDKYSRFHLHSACGLLHDNYRVSTMDYGHLMDCAFKLEKHVYAYEKVYRLASFNVLAHNRDDHSKNFSFLMDEKGEWRFAPAYDLTFSVSAFGHHSTMVAGESKNPGKEHLGKLAKHFDIKNSDAILEQVQYAVSNWKKYAIDAEVSKPSMNKINRMINF